MKFYRLRLPDIATYHGYSGWRAMSVDVWWSDTDTPSHSNTPRLVPARGVPAYHTSFNGYTWNHRSQRRPSRENCVPMKFRNSRSGFLYRAILPGD